MPNTIRFLAVLIAVVALSSHGYAQTPGKGLKGFASVQINVVDIDQDARNCGVTIASLRSAASFPVATSRLRIEKEAVLFLSIFTTVIQETDGCVGAYRAQAWAVRAVGAKFLVVEYWTSGGLITGPRGTFGRRMSGSIDRIVKEFVVAWTLDQQ